ncbi:MAG: hypothetical protein EHM45_05365 [Desulfobacteraceae bacterium]|nr:MAG: hypothetical protein EHM45_05365 [Desulfobacteraceae bacterium]
MKAFQNIDGFKLIMIFMALILLILLLNTPPVSNFVTAQNTAWLGERLMNEKYGECRGTGVLIKVKGDWKFTQYNLVIPIPNDIAQDVVKMIREATKNPK